MRRKESQDVESYRRCIQKLRRQNREAKRPTKGAWASILREVRDSWAEDERFERETCTCKIRRNKQKAHHVLFLHHVHMAVFGVSFVRSLHFHLSPNVPSVVFFSPASVSQREPSPRRISTDSYVGRFFPRPRPTMECRPVVLCLASPPSLKYLPKMPLISLHTSRSPTYMHAHAVCMHARHGHDTTHHWPCRP